MNTVSVCLVDRSKLFREGLRRIFEDSTFSIQCEVSTVEDLATIHCKSPPDLILADLHDSSKPLADQIALLREFSPSGFVVILTSEMATQRLIAAVNAGVDGYLVKDMSADALKQSLRLVLLGEKVFPTNLVPLLLNGGMSHGIGGDDRATSSNLSRRDLQILSCLLNGDSNKAIANQLNITEGTVKVHLKAVLRKIKAQNRTQAAIWALNNGIAASP